MPQKYTTGTSTRRTTDLKYPTQSDGVTKDKRYKSPQFTKDNGTRDMRTKLTGQRK